MRILAGIAIVLTIVLAFVISHDLQKGTTSAPAAAAIQPTREQLAKAKKCRAAIKTSPLVRTYQWQDGSLTAEIGPSFYEADYDTKDALNKLLVCAATDGTMQGITFVDYLDWRTHQSVASWTPSSGLHIR